MTIAWSSAQQGFDQTSGGTIIKTGGRLVKQQHVGLHSENAGEADKPLLAAGKLVGDPLLHAVKSERGERAPGEGDGGGAIKAEIERPEDNVLKDRRAKELIVRILEQQPGAAADLVKIALPMTDAAEGLDDAAVRH